MNSRCEYCRKNMIPATLLLGRNDGTRLLICVHQIPDDATRVSGFEWREAKR